MKIQKAEDEGQKIKIRKKIREQIITVRDSLALDHRQKKSRIIHENLWHFKKFYKRLKKKGLENKVMTVITADHGQYDAKKPVSTE